MSEETRLLAKMMKDDPDYFKVLNHLKIANLDYAKNISKYTKIDINKVSKILEELKEIGLIEEVHSKTVKRVKARLKKQFQVRMHHTYYKLTLLGKQVYKYLRDNN
jgi:predicted transcriptional regulator